MSPLKSAVKRPKRAKKPKVSKPKVLIKPTVKKPVTVHAAAPKKDTVVKRPAKRRPKKLRPRGIDYTLFHLRNFLRRTPVNRTKLQAGDVAMFYYQGKYSTHPRPIVLILNRYYKGKTHALAMRHLSERALGKLMTIVLRTARMDKLTGETAFYRIPIDKRNPKVFYRNKVKLFMRTNAKVNPYRTYMFYNLRSTLLIDYKFKFFATPVIK